MKEISKKLKSQNRLLRFLYISISLILSAVLYNLLLLPLSIVTGGTSGIATITHYLYGFNPSIMIFLISFSCLIVSFMYLGKERTAGSILACIAYPLLVQLTSFLNNHISTSSDVLMLVLFAGTLSGVSNGLMYKSGYSSGGLPIISQIIFEKWKIPVAKTSLIMNVIIVLIGGLFFGTTNALYAIIFLYINSIVMDKVLLGISNNKAFYIITHKETEIKDYIINELNHTVTTFDVKGGFFDNKKKVILTIIPTREYYRVTEGIKEIDNKVFFVATDSYEVEGGK